MANVKFKQVTNAQQTTEAIEEDKLLYNYESQKIHIDKGGSRIPFYPTDTTLSTISTNAVANSAITGSIVNTLAEVNAITADYIPCGTKPLKTLNNYSKNYYTESSTELQIGDNLYTYTIIMASAIPVGVWTTLATFPPATYKNLRIDFGLSYMLNNDLQMLALDSYNGTTGMVRLATATGEVQVYSASVANLKASVKLIYSK